MGHHRGPSSAPGWFGRLIRWWNDGRTQDMARKADEALWKSQAQRPQVERAVDFAERALHAFESRPKGRPT